MLKAIETEHVACPLCGADKPKPWATESGYSAVRCGACSLVYVTPRPIERLVTEATVMGQHETESGVLNIKANRQASRVNWLSNVVKDMYSQEIGKAQRMRWLDVGAGYGEFVEALTASLPVGSSVSGIEPMKHKVDAANALGLPIEVKYLSEIQESFDVVSLMNVFSHVPNFKEFLQDVRKKLTPTGEVFIQTGNGGDLAKRSEYPDPLYLPDHLVFAGEVHIEKYLSNAGFVLISKRSYRVDSPWHFAKNVVKRVLGRPSWILLPYTSKFRTVVYRARLA